MKKLLAYAIAAFAFLLTSRVWAGPGTPAMASLEATPDSAAPVAATVAITTFESLPAAPEAIPSNVEDLFADADEVSPTDPHPMIPLPPALWAGFAGLAFIAHRVLRRRPTATA